MFQIVLLFIDYYVLFFFVFLMLVCFVFVLYLLPFGLLVDCLFVYFVACWWCL